MELERRINTQDGLITDLHAVFENQVQEVRQLYIDTKVQAEVRGAKLATHEAIKDDDGFPFCLMGQEEMEALEQDCKEDLTNKFASHMVTLKMHLQKFRTNACKSPFKPLPRKPNGGDGDMHTPSRGGRMGSGKGSGTPGGGTPKKQIKIPGAPRDPIREVEEEKQREEERRKTEEARK